MRNWSECISYRRFGYQSSTRQPMRSEFIRDYDRIIFLSAFRRLQDKTQVFPLPGNLFVHNRLTHSLEVSSVGRSLGVIVGNFIADNFKKELTPDESDFYRYELAGVITSACLAHDLGNPAFGHSGEKAISNYFETHKDFQINGRPLSTYFNDDEWKDITHFEGNANALRLLTRQYKGRLPGGQSLMMVTLASILKYPCSSAEINKSFVHTKKYGYFQSDKEAFARVIDEFNLKSSDGHIKRHPFVFLVEAADDICYRIIDMEDAHRIGLLSRQDIEYYFLATIRELGHNTERTEEVLRLITDDNEAVSFLRAKCIHELVKASCQVFKDNQAEILRGNFNSSLMDEVEKKCIILKEITKISIDKIYNHRSVIEVEIAGYNVMSELLSVFVSAILSDERTAIHNKCLHLIPEQYNFADENISAYEKTMSILDFISGMTDGYATELYRKLKGIDIASHSVG